MTVQDMAGGEIVTTYSSRSRAAATPHLLLPHQVAASFLRYPTHSLNLELKQ